MLIDDAQERFRQNSNKESQLCKLSSLLAEAGNKGLLQGTVVGGFPDSEADVVLLCHM